MSAVPAPTEQWRAELLAGREALRQSYQRAAAPQRQLHAHSRLIDRTLRGLWRGLRASPPPPPVGPRGAWGGGGGPLSRT